jgi:hypothetical protein
LLVETSNRQWKFAFMAESFGGEFTIVVTLDDGSPTQMWVALAKPNQAMTLVLAAVPEGSTV